MNTQRDEQKARTTKLDSFLSGAPFSAGKLARVADMAPQHLSAIRAGNASPTEKTINRIVRAATELSGKKVLASDLFDLDGAEDADQQQASADRPKRRTKSR